MTREFDTDVQLVKYKVLKAVSEKAWAGELLESIPGLPAEIIPGDRPTMRCCVYKERAIINERVRIAISGSKPEDSIVEVIGIACDECPVGGYEVSTACRGCIAHRCHKSCPRDAIVFDHMQKAHIDKAKCVECGRCATVCPYSAIINHKRPCENACKIGAISMNEKKEAAIDKNKCISCGACVYQCPFGAIQDKSFILDTVEMIKQSQNNEKYKVYAIVAPSISSQFTYARLSQLITGIKKLGFFHVVEVALGADLVALEESKELMEKGFLTSSCCPAFVEYIHKFFPEMVQHISHNLSPMAMIAKHIKESDPTAKIVFIGPCTAKKQEFKRENVKKLVDCVITFEELQALLDSKSIDLSVLEDGVLDNASYFGRIFARSGGLSDAVRQALEEQGLDANALRRH